jgi:hypothetical protein
MADYTVKTIAEIEAVHGGTFRRARAALGVSSFGFQVLDFPALFDKYPEHDHAGTGQEEVYVVIDGSGEVEIDGERVPLSSETMVRVGPNARRRIWVGPQGLRVLAIGGVPDQPYRAPRFTELGAVDLVKTLPNSKLSPLLRDPECPSEAGPTGTRVIELREFVRFAESRLGKVDGLDERLDQFLTHLGGTQIERDNDVAFALPIEHFGEPART